MQPQGEHALLPLCPPDLLSSLHSHWISVIILLLHLTLAEKWEKYLDIICIECNSHLILPVC